MVGSGFDGIRGRVLQTSTCERHLPSYSTALGLDFIVFGEKGER